MFENLMRNIFFKNYVTHLTLKYFCEDSFIQNGFIAEKVFKKFVFCLNWSPDENMKTIKTFGVKNRQ